VRALRLVVLRTARAAVVAALAVVAVTAFFHVWWDEVPDRLMGPSRGELDIKAKEAIATEFETGDSLLEQVGQVVADTARGDFGVTAEPSRSQVVEFYPLRPRLRRAVPIELQLLVECAALTALFAAGFAKLANCRGFVSHLSTSIARWLWPAGAVLLFLRYLPVVVLHADWTLWVRLTDDPLRSIVRPLYPCVVASLFLAMPLYQRLVPEFAQPKDTRRPGREVLAGLREHVGYYFGAFAIIEYTYAYPGLMTTAVSRAGRNDLPAVRGTIIFIALLILAIRLALDLTIDALDAIHRKRAKRPTETSPGPQSPA
jgi:ABC-type dipeptide/oligopeptide/nickel transport system permease component